MPVQKKTKKFIKNNLKKEIEKRKQRQKFKKNSRKPTSFGDKHVNEDVDMDHDSALDSASDIEDSMLDASLENDVELSSASESESEIDDIENFEVSSDEEEPEDGDEEEDTIEQHIQDLEKLKETDPEFFKYLQENDQTLLNFAETAPIEDEEDDEEEEEAAEQDEEMESTIPLTKAIVSKWKNSLVQHKSVKSLRNILVALKTAVAAGETENEESVPMQYKIEDSSVFNMVVLAVVKNVPEALNKHLVPDFAAAQEKNQKINPSSHKKWKKLNPLVKSFLTNLLKLFKQVSDPAMLGFVVRESLQAMPYYACFPKLSKDYIKAMIKFWSSGDEKVRIYAFMNLRKLALHSPAALGRILKHAYTSFQSVCRLTNAFTLPTINFLTNCLVELFGLSSQTAYSLLFMNIREIAIRLRTAIMHPSKDSFKNIISWQVVHSLTFISRVLSEYCNGQTGVESGEDLKVLIYPFVQVSIGCLRLKPTPKYYPLQKRILNALMNIARSTRTYIPILNNILVLFTSPLMAQPKPSTMKPVSMETILKFPDNYAGTRPFAHQIYEDSVNLVTDFIDIWRENIGFPEMMLPFVHSIRKLMKKNKKSMELVRLYKPLLAKIQEQINHVQMRRDKCDFAPKDVKACELFEKEGNGPFQKYAEIRKNFMKKQAEMNEAQPIQDQQETSQPIKSDDDEVVDFVMSDDE